MKKFFIIGVVVLCFAVAAHQIIRQANILGYSGKIISWLTHDLGDFYGEHKRLPENWAEFVSWSDNQKRICHWKVSELEPLFALQWGATISSEKAPDKRLFIVLDRHEFAGIESTVNNELYFRCLNSVPIQQNQTTHP